MFYQLRQVLLKPPLTRRPLTEDAQNSLIGVRAVEQGSPELDLIVQCDPPLSPAPQLSS